MKTITNFASGAVTEEMVHLTEEQIDEQLMGDRSSAVAAHLDECEKCMQRVAEAAEPMAAFRDVTMAWSERRSATMPIPAAQADALVWQRRVGWAMTACALVVGLSFTGNARKAEMLRASVQSAQSVDTVNVAQARVAAVPVSVDRATGDVAAEERYSGDNKMLKAIDNELAASVETPAAMGLETVSEQHVSPSGASSVED